MTNPEGRRRNPYIVGTPINKRELFFGRESLFGFIEDNLKNDEQIILLHGQRRIGKSSVLMQIPQFFAQREFQELIFVNFDLQDKARLALSQVLHLLSTEIFDLVNHHNILAYDRVIPPTVAALEVDIDIFSRNFLSEVLQELGQRKLVLLLDEFDVLSDEHTESADKQFFPYLKELIEQHQKLFIIPVVGRNLDDMPNLLTLFGRVPYQEIGFLDELSAKRLITNPAKGMLEYDEDAIRAILELSAGHPYFTQIICNALFGQARAENKSRVNRGDVEGIIDRAIANAEGGLIWFWQGLPISEQVVFSAVAEAQKIALEKSQRVPDDPLTLLKNNGVIPTQLLIQAAHRLANKGYLDNTDRRVKIEFVRRWLLQRYPLQQEKRQLEKLEPEEVNRLWEQATRLSQQGKKRNAVERYQQILEINPNHFSTVVALAKDYLKLEDFDKALEFHQRAYQFDPISNEEGLLDALDTYGKKLILQREFTTAKEKYSRILEIEPENLLARQQLQEIAAFELGSNNSNQYIYKQMPLGGMAAAVVVGMIALVSVGFGIYRWSTPCPTGEQKVNGIFCQAKPSNISRGESTLFFNIANPNRDQGIETFKQGDYKQAAEFFKNAVVANRNDPEVLIYYNNARAKQQGSPLTLAVVVPVDNEQRVSQEMLRGVAQAQNQFNAEGGLNGRLLEIAIANDANNADQARLVAQELVQDPSILGVIGHDSSEDTRRALPEYEKANLAIISPTSSSTYLNSKVFFRTTSNNAVEGKKLAEYLRTLNVNKGVVFYNPESIYSNSMREEFIKYFTQILVRKPIDLTSPTLNVDEEVKASVSAQAQAALLFPDVNHYRVGLEIARSNAKIPQAQRLKLLGGSGFYSDKTLKDGGKDVEGLILPVPWFREAPESKDFAQKAEKQWGGGVSWSTATSFDATQAFIHALSSNPSRSTVLQKLPQVNLSASQTSGKPLKFTPERERQSDPILVMVKGGKFVQLP